MIKQIGLLLRGRPILLIRPNWTPLSPVTITNDNDNNDDNGNDDDDDDDDDDDEDNDDNDNDNDNNDNDNLLLLWRFAPYHFFNVEFMRSNPYVAN